MCIISALYPNTDIPLPCFLTSLFLTIKYICWVRMEKKPKHFVSICLKRSFYFVKSISATDIFQKGYVWTTNEVQNHFNWKKLEFLLAASHIMEISTDICTYPKVCVCLCGGELIHACGGEYKCLLYALQKADKCLTTKNVKLLLWCCTALHHSSDSRVDLYTYMRKHTGVGGLQESDKRGTSHSACAFL